MCLSLASRRSCLYFAWPVCGVFFPQDFLNIALKVFQSPEVEIPSFLRVARGAGRRPTVSRPRITPSNHAVTSCAYVGACPLIMLRCQYMVSYNAAAAFRSASAPGTRFFAVSVSISSTHFSRSPSLAKPAIPVLISVPQSVEQGNTWGVWGVHCTDPSRPPCDPRLRRLWGRL